MRLPDRYLFVVRRRLGFHVGQPHLLTASLAIEDRIAAALGIREYVDEGLSIDLFHDEPDLGSGMSRHPIAVDHPSVITNLVDLARGTASPFLREGIPPDALSAWSCQWRQAPVQFRFLPSEYMTRDPDSPRPRLHVKLDGSWLYEGPTVEHKPRLITAPVGGGGVVPRVVSMACSCGYHPPPGVDADDAIAFHTSVATVLYNTARSAS